MTTAKKQKKQQRKKFNEKVYLCGDRIMTFLSVASFAVAASIPATNVPAKEVAYAMVGIMSAAAGFSMAALQINKNKKNKEKTNKTDLLKKVQRKMALISFCGVAVAHEMELSLIKEHTDYYEKNTYSGGKTSKKDDLLRVRWDDKEKKSYTKDHEKLSCGQELLLLSQRALFVTSHPHMSKYQEDNDKLMKNLNDLILKQGDETVNNLLLHKKEKLRGNYG